MSTTRVLILGGYGTFGRRLAQLLADEPRLTLIIAGRARDKAEDFYESAEGGRFQFHVEIRLPLFGLIVGYRGWLLPRA